MALSLQLVIYAGCNWDRSAIFHTISCKKKKGGAGTTKKKKKSSLNLNNKNEKQKSVWPHVILFAAETILDFKKRLWSQKRNVYKIVHFSACVADYIGCLGNKRKKNNTLNTLNKLKKNNYLFIFFNLDFAQPILPCCETFQLQTREKYSIQRTKFSPNEIKQKNFSSVFSQDTFNCSTPGRLAFEIS